MKYLRKFWGWLKSPFSKVEATEEVIDRQTNAVVQYRRPEEMRIMRWTANTTYAIKEDIEDTAQTVTVMSPVLLYIYGYMGIVWLLWIAAAAFGMAMKGVGVIVILQKLLTVTWTMGVVVAAITIVYAISIGIFWLGLRISGRFFNKVTGRKAMTWGQALRAKMARAF